MYEFFSKHALLVVNHNEDDLATSREDTDAQLVPLIISTIAYKPVSVTKGGAYVLVPSSFASDEPIELIFETARLMPQLEFRLTGNVKKVSADLLHTAPPNVTFLGYLTRDEYYSQMVSSNAVLTLSKRSHIMQMAAEEAMCLECALVTNKSPILEKVFGEGALFVELEPQDLASGLHTAIENQFQRIEAMRAARDKYKKYFDVEVAKIKEKLNLAG